MINHDLDRWVSSAGMVCVRNYRHLTTWLMSRFVEEPHKQMPIKQDIAELLCSLYLVVFLILFSFLWEQTSVWGARLHCSVLARCCDSSVSYACLIIGVVAALLCLCRYKKENCEVKKKCKQNDKWVSENERRFQHPIWSNPAHAKRALETSLQWDCVVALALPN